MTNGQEWSHLWHHRELNVSFLQAFHAVEGYPRHSHDYYVIAVVDRGIQSFLHGGSKYVTPVGGLILLNPGEVHTGEPLNEIGYGYRAIYPTIEHMRMISSELGRGETLPFFAEPRVDDLPMTRRVRALFTSLCEGGNALKTETRFLLTLGALVQRYGGERASGRSGGTAHDAVQKVRDYIHENYAQPIALAQLADHVNFSRYYLVTLFRDEMGMPPHVYLETVRIRQAQTLLAEGAPLADVAYAVGFASQSHFTQRFKRIIGVTPGVYARQVRN